MTFEKIKSDTACTECLTGAITDMVSIFARGLNKEKVSDKDFMSKWDKGHRSEECDEVHGLKGISVSKVENDTIKSEVISIYKQILTISPKYKRGVLMFTCKNDAGMVKATPNDKNIYHHDFYKADDFSLLFITELETIIL